MPADAVRTYLEDAVRARASEAAWRAFDAARTAIAARPALMLDTVMTAFTSAPRTLGRQALALDAAEIDRLRAIDRELSFARWHLEDAGRALLLMATMAADTGGTPDLLLAVHEQADAREQQSWMRALPLLSHPERFLETAIDTCRTNILPLFEAIACENPYPARFFPELNFNQMVLKALFNGVRLSRIAGLERRLNPELARMAGDYVDEREAAHRSVPADIWMVTAPRRADGAKDCRP